ncbi:MAG: VOC family protein [Nanoarchaeota archaeon]|nr:VOC family protein [Nanoarchaeota archaeon]
MGKQLFVNLPVKDLSKSAEFFKKLGFTFNQQFTNESGGCLVLGENLYAMLLVEKFFKTFTVKAIADAKKTTEVLVAISVDSKDLVDEIVERAIAAGGKPFGQTQDHGFMYGRDFEDLDGHVWEIFWMDPAHVNKK